MLSKRRVIMTIFDALKSLTEREIFFCFQSRAGYKFYNLAVADPTGKVHHFHSDNLGHIKDELDLMWDFDKPAVVKTTARGSKKLPIPAGLPVP